MEKTRVLICVVLLAVVAPATSSTRESSLRDDHNSKETARLIDLGEPVSGHIWPRGDRDFYHLWLPSPGILTIEHMAIPPGITSMIRVHDGNGVVGRWVASGPGLDHVVEAAIGQASRVWVEVADSRRYNYSTSPYNLELSFLPIIDPHEPNDLSHQATPLSLPATVTGYLFPAGDIDRFRVLLTEPGGLRILLTGSDPQAGSRIRVNHEDGRRVTGWIRDRDRGYQNLLIDITRPGVHEIILTANEARDIRTPYRLRVEHHPRSKDRHEPNDTIETATPIVPGQVVQGYLLPANDIDVYRLDLRGVGRLLVRQTGLRDGLRSSLEVRGPGGRVSLTNGTRDGAPGETEAEIFVPIKGWGDYYVIVRSPDRELRTMEPYELRCIFFNRQRARPDIPAIQGMPPE